MIQPFPEKRQSERLAASVLQIKTVTQRPTAQRAGWRMGKAIRQTQAGFRATLRGMLCDRHP